MSKKQQGAPAKTEPWTLFFGNKFQDGIAVLFSSPSSLFVQRQRASNGKHFLTVIFLIFDFRIPGKRLKSESTEFGALFSLLFFPFFHNKNPKGRGHLLKSRPLGSRCLECFVDKLLVPNWASDPLECAVYLEFSFISRPSWTIFPCSWSPNAVWVLRHVSWGRARRPWQISMRRLE